MALTKVSGNLIQQQNFSVGVVTATSFTGDLTGNVTGNVTGDLTGNVTGDLTGNVTGNVSSSGANTLGSLTVTNDATVGGALTVTGNLTVNGTTTTIDTVVTAIDTLAVDGDVTAGGNLNITGVSTFTDNIELLGSTQIGSGSNQGVRITEDGIQFQREIGDWSVANSITFTPNVNGGTVSVQGRNFAELKGDRTKLSVGYDGDITGYTYDGSGSSQRFVVKQITGNVGINSTSPGRKLTVAGGGTSLIASIKRTDGASAYLTLSDNSTTSDSYVGVGAEGDGLKLRSGNSDRVYVNSSGSVGINSDAPARTLDVTASSSTMVAQFRSGTFNNQSYICFANPASNADQVRIGSYGSDLIASTNYTERLRITSTGNVGIGTTNPDKKLRVEGDARITGTLTMGTASISIDGAHEYPSIRPTLDLNFAATKTLDRRITFTRDSLGTYTDELGIVRTAPNNTPRFDHDPATGESLGLLIEESRTNFITNSETPLSAQGSNLTSSYLTVSAVSNVVSPDGTTNGVVRYTTNANGSGTYRFGNTTDGIAETTYTGSIWIKSATGSDVSMNIDVNDRGTLTFTATTEWRRVSVSAAREGAFTHRFMDINSGPSKDFYIWGPQLELGSFPTSYIPTSGSTVTRAADFAKITGTNFTDFYNSTEGTLFAESSIADLTAENQGTVQLWYSSTDHIGMGYRWGASGSGTYGFYIRNTSDQLYRAPSGVTANTFVKASLAYKSDAPYGASSLNGETAVVDTSINLPTAATEMTIGYGNASPSTYRMKQGHIKSLKYYNKRLPDSQLQGLTAQ